MFDQLEGVGPARRRALLRHFGSAERVLAATRGGARGRARRAGEDARGRSTRSCTGPAARDGYGLRPCAGSLSSLLVAAARRLWRLVEAATARDDDRDRGRRSRDRVRCSTRAATGRSSVSGADAPGALHLRRRQLAAGHAPARVKVDDPRPAPGDARPRRRRSRSQITAQGAARRVGALGRRHRAARRRAAG